MTNSTVVALATPVGAAGLAVIRLSGPAAFSIAKQVFSAESFGTRPAPRRAVYGILKHPGSEPTRYESTDCVIDQAVALPFLGPHSYTGEDTVEFMCHGGRVVVNEVLAACRAAGAEPAVAGEFTRRAFLNGKLSLDQAEAVADLIHASSARGARAAIKQVLGGLDKQLVDIERPLLDLLARLEGSLEFVSDEEIDVPRENVVAVLTDSVERLDRLVAMAPAGRLLRDGIHIVLAGPTNVGKSSLFNALLEDERAIVDAEAGTTRDVISGRIERGGSVFVLHDTAGLRAEPGRVEQMGIERTWREVGRADIVLALSVAGEPPNELSVAEGAPVIAVGTKQDLMLASDEGGGLAVSAVTGEGLAELWGKIDETVAGFALEEAVGLGVVLNERHLHRLTSCRTELARLLTDIETNEPGDEVIGSMLASVLSALGEISGRVFSENLLENIFQRFCVGK